MKNHLLKSFAAMVMACGSYALANATTTNTKGFAFDNASEIKTGVTYGKATADGVHNNLPAKKKEQTRFLVKQENFGDTQGFIPKDLVGNYYHYYYNANGKLVGSIRYGRKATDKTYYDTFSATNITKGVYDENGNLTAEDNYQYGQYDGDLSTWKKMSYTNYTYDANGNVATEETKYQRIAYTYNEDNTLAKKETYIKSKTSDILQQSISYTSFNEFGNPTHAVSTGSYDTYKYEVDFEYDANGNELSEYQYQKVTGDDGTEKIKPTMLKTWTYENGVLTAYQENTFNADGKETPTIKYTYAQVNDNPNVIDQLSYSYMLGTWITTGGVSRNYYKDFSDKKDNTKVDLTVEKDATFNNIANLSFTIPQLANSTKCKVAIFRDCQPIDTVEITAIVDPASNTCKYQDKGVKNGSYSYFVQPLFAPNDGGISPLTAIDGEDKGNTDTDEPEYEGYFSSTPVDVTFDIDLPTATDLRFVSGRVERGSLFEEAKYYATIEWKNPSNMEKYGFEKNIIYLTDQWNRVFTANEYTNSTTEKAEVAVDSDVKIQVATFYKSGRVFSNSIDVTLKQIEATNSIETLTGSNTSISFNGKNITLSDNANVSVYSANGQQVYSGKNVSSVSLGNMPDGAYIICVEKNSKVNVYKYNAK